MTEAVVASTDVLLKPSVVTSCDVVSCPSPTSCLPLCNQKEGVECQSDFKKLEQQVSNTKRGSTENYAFPPPMPVHAVIINCILTCRNSAARFNQRKKSR